MQLLERMKQAGKSWSLYVFSSVNAIRKYTMEELVQLGVSWIWLGLESPNSTYAKLHDADTQALAAELRQHGIKLLGSTIVGLEHHTPENIRAGDRIRGLSRHRLSPVHALHAGARARRCSSRCSRKDACSTTLTLPTSMGNSSSTFSHAAISRDESKQFLDWAFRFDFERNGPSLFRICETIFQGWKRYHDSSRSARARNALKFEAVKLRTTYNAALWAMEKRLQKTNSAVSGRIRELRREIEREFGLATRSLRMVAGPLLLWTSKREDRRLARGQDLRAADLRRAQELAGLLRVARKYFARLGPCTTMCSWPRPRFTAGG